MIINQHNKIIITQNFSKKAQSYSKNSSIQFSSAQKLIKYLSQYSQENFNQESSIVALDIGSGSSFIAQNLFNNYNNIHLYEVDLSPSMLDVFTPKNNNKITKICADIEKIEFAHKSFDIIFACFSLQWINDLEKLSIKIKKSLKNSGIFVGCFPTNASFQNLKNFPFKIKNLPEANDYHATLKNLGFKNILIKNIKINQSYNNVIDALKSFKHNGTNYPEPNLNNFEKLKKFYLNNIHNNVNFNLDWFISYFIYKND